MSKSPAQLDREIAQALAEHEHEQAARITPVEHEHYRRGRGWGWPAHLAFKSATGRPLSRTPPPRSR